METYYIVRVIVDGETRYAGGPEFTPWFEDAFMFKVPSIAGEIGGSYGAQGRKVDIYQLEFKGSYEV